MKAQGLIAIGVGIALIVSGATVYEAATWQSDTLVGIGIGLIIAVLAPRSWKELKGFFKL